MSDLVLHVKEFLNLVNKCSLSNTFETFQVLVSSDKVKSSTTNANQSVVSIFNLQNNFIEGIKEGEVLEFNFISPAVTIVPQASLFSGNELKCKIDFSKGFSVAKMKVAEKETKASATWNFGVPNPVFIFSNNAKLKSFQPFAEFDVNEDFLGTANAIKKAAAGLNKLYFTTLKDKVRIEATDYKNDYSSNFRIELLETELPTSHQKVIMNYDFNTFFSILKQVDLDKNFTCRLIYRPDRKNGCMIITCEDDSELYFMPSVREDYMDEGRVRAKLEE